jgi:serine/threonine protein kinase
MRRAIGVPANPNVFSLAATLYALLAGKPPRWPDDGSSPSLPEILERQRQPIERLPTVAPAFMNLLVTALADDPDDRPTAAQFRDQLAALELPGDEPDSWAVPAVGEDRKHAATPADSTERPRRRRNAVLLALVLLVLAVITASAVAWMRAEPSTAPASTVAPAGSPPGETSPETSDQPSSVQSPAPPDTSTGAEPSPSGPVIPAGFSPCPKDLGKDNFCVDKPECWNDYQQFFDIPAYANLTSCKREHLYQTYAAGLPSGAFRTQSQLTADPQVRKLCSPATVATVVGRNMPRDWQIQRLPPPLQLTDDPLFRCLVSTGELRSSPIGFENLN